ncbi:MAG: DUF2807 domain-containing protein [Cytophagales bacterium]|nr:DUF2807 domain-containing protein [Cytophagales bacterium]
MLKTCSFVLISMGAALLTSCGHLRFERGNGDIILQTIEVSGFEKVDVRGFYEVTLQPGTKEGVTIETDENLFDFIEVFVRGNKLIIASEESLKSDFGIKIAITYKALKAISSSGASVIKTNGTVTTEDLKIAMSGAGLIEMDVETQMLDLNLSGAGMVRLSGETDEQFLELSGAGSLDAYELKSDACSVNLSGVGAAKVYVKEKLDARVSGIGGIKYRGNPKSVNKNVSGLGKVKRDENDNETVI